MLSRALSHFRKTMTTEAKPEREAPALLRGIFLTIQQYPGRFPRFKKILFMEAIRALDTHLGPPAKRSPDGMILPKWILDVDSAAKSHAEKCHQTESKLEDFLLKLLTGKEWGSRCTWVLELCGFKDHLISRLIEYATVGKPANRYPRQPNQPSKIRRIKQRASA